MGSPEFKQAPKHTNLSFLGASQGFKHRVKLGYSSKRMREGFMSQEKQSLNKHFNLDRIINSVGYIVFSCRRIKFLFQENQNLLGGTFPFNSCNQVCRSSRLHGTSEGSINSKLEVRSWFIRQKRGKGFRDKFYNSLVVGETETFEQGLTDKLCFRLLRVLAQSIIPVIPAPTELNKIFTRKK